MYRISTRILVIGTHSMHVCNPT